MYIHPEERFFFYVFFEYTYPTQRDLLAKSTYFIGNLRKFNFLAEFYIKAKSIS